MAQPNESAKGGQATTNAQVLLNPDDFSFDGSRVWLFTKLLTVRAGRLIKLNLLTLLFAAPAIAALFYYMLSNVGIGMIYPYSANFGIGYPGSVDAVAIGQAEMFLNNLRMFSFAAGGLVLLFVGLSGAFYAMRPLARGEAISTLKLFFIGIKKHALSFLLVTPLPVALFFLTAVGFSGFSTFAMPTVLKVLLLVLLCLLSVVTLSILIFYFTLTVSFQMPLKERFKNSAALAAVLLPRNLIILAFSAIPFVLLFVLIPIEIVSVIAMTLGIMFLFSIIVLLWTVYSHWVFDRQFATEPISVKTVKEAEPQAVQEALPEVQKFVKKSATAQKKEVPKKETTKNESKPQHNSTAQKKEAAFKFTKKR